MQNDSKNKGLSTQQILEQIHSLSLDSNSIDEPELVHENLSNDNDIVESEEIPTLRLKSLKPYKEIGSGHNTKIVLRKNDMGMNYVTKIMMLKGEPESKPHKIFTQEVTVLNALKEDNSPNIVKMYNHYYGYDPKKSLNLYCIDLEYVNLGSLDNIIERQSPEKYTLPIRIEWMIDITKALSYLHRQGFIHYDIKPGNILVQFNDGTYSAKLTDFGTSSTDPEAVWGTVMWMAPETFACRFGLEPPIEMKACSSTAVDIYCLGLVIFAVTTWNPLVAEEYFSVQRQYGTIRCYMEYGADRKLGEARLAGKIETIPDTTPKILANCMYMTWHTNPKDRPTAEQLGASLQEAKEEVQMICKI